MWTLLIFIGFFVVVVLLVVKIDSLSKAHKRMVMEYKLRDQESSHLQHLTYELAEECSQILLQQLLTDKINSRLPPSEVHCIETLCQAIPAICKELVQKQLSVPQALQRYCKRNLALEYAELEVFINRHGRLIQGWQKNSFAGYLQLCQSGVMLVREQSYKDFGKTNRPLSEPA